MTDKIKIYKNPKRSENATYTKYVPNYQNMGVEPQEFKSAMVSPNTPVIQRPSAENPRIRPTGLQPSPDKVVKGPVPNVGNNMDYTWSGVDNHVINDLQEYPTSPDHPMIDNNDFVTDEALNMSSSEDVHEEDILPIINDLESGSYLLLVNNVPICSGPTSEIEDQVRALIFGEHELSGGVPISENNIIVIKKVPIKVGVFLD